MPPRKRARLAAAKLAVDVSAGAQTCAVATQADDVPEIMKTVSNLMDSVYTLRHHDSKTIHHEAIGLLVPEDGSLPWPICFGGTYKEIAQRAWTEPERLIDMSAELACRVGLSESADSTEFAQQFCKVEASGFLLACRLPTT